MKQYFLLFKIISFPRRPNMILYLCQLMPNSFMRKTQYKCPLKIYLLLAPPNSPTLFHRNHNFPQHLHNQALINLGRLDPLLSPLTLLWTITPLLHLLPLSQDVLLDLSNPMFALQTISVALRHIQINHHQHACIPSNLFCLILTSLSLSITTS